MVDLIVRGGTLVTPDGVPEGVVGDVAIADGRIAAVGRVDEAARHTIDARGAYVLPAIVDAHVHFNEPGRTDWEGGATGSRALAAGGGTVFVDMPLNSSPCTVDTDAFDRKRAALEASSIADFALWGGLVPGSIGAMRELADRGVVGFKAFMTDSGLPEFPHVDDATLLEGLKEAARLGLPVAVHAERDALIRTPATRHTKGTVRDFLASRPIDAEVQAIERATALAGEAGAMLHIVHVSSGRGVEAAVAARQRGVDVSIETCPHYLWFTEDDVERLGAVAKCAPPLRPRDVRESLWHALLTGHIDLVGSDHSPTVPARKDGPFGSAWGGIAGVQSTLAVLLEAGVHGRGLPIARVAALASREPARRFRLAGKGELAVGFDADLAIVDIDKPVTLTADDLQQRHKISPYLGVPLRGAVRRTLRRGETIYADGRIVAQTPGRFVRPTR